MEVQIATYDESGMNAGTTFRAGQAFVDRLGEQLSGGNGSDTVLTERAKEKKEIERLRSKSQEYLDNEQHWKFLLLAYEGGPCYTSDSTLFKHQREHSRDFSDRLKRAHYSNYCQPLVDFVPEYIFSQGIERHAPPELAAQFELFKANCDRSGTSLDMFMQSLGEDIRIFGMCFVQVDKMPTPDGIQARDISVKQASELGLDQPYLIAIRPLEVLRWTTDSIGNYIYLKRMEKTETVDSFGNVTCGERYTEWTPEWYKISTIDTSDRDNPRISQWGVMSENKWKQIPYVPVFFKRSKASVDVGQSFIADIAYQNRHVFNLTSLLDEFLYRQCFNMLVMPMKTMLPTKEQVEGDMGTSNVLEIPELSQHKPEYLSPPVEPAKFIQEERQSTIHEMYRAAAQDVMLELTKGADRSGDAQKVGFSRTIPVINKTADTLEHGERTLIKLWAKMQGKKWDGGKISYKDDYSVTNLLDLLTQLGMIFGVIKLQSPTFIREEWKRIIREFDGKLDPAAMSKIVAEIDKMTDDDIAQLFITAGDMQAMPGVPSTANAIQGNTQSKLGSDKKIAAATGSKAATKEVAPDKNKRTKTATKAKARTKSTGQS